jgi:hypothetical protein
VRPVGLIRSMAPLPGWAVVCGYERLMAGLGRLPGAVVDDGHPDRRVLDANVVAFPYDFRQSVVAAAERLAAEVGERLSALGAPGERGRVVVVAHSLGGLVARYWLGPLGGWRVCRALVTLGTPHRGAPKALGWMTGGVRVGGRVWKGATGLIRGWPSVAELLPRYPAVWNQAGGCAWYPHELPLGWLRPVARRAFGVHEDVEVAWEGIPGSGPEVVPRIGWSHDTPDAAFWDQDTGLRVVKERPGWLEAPGWENDLGDGTVPAVSALPVGLENWAVSTTGIRVRQRHSRLVFSKPMIEEIMARLEDYEGRPVPGPGRPAYRDAQERGAALGLDIDEVHPLGEPIRLCVRVRGADADVRRVAVAAVLRPVDGPAATGQPVAAWDGRLVWDEGLGGFAGEVIPGRAGVYELSVRADAVPGAGDLAVTESVAVIEG